MTSTALAHSHVHTVLAATLPSKHATIGKPSTRRATSPEPHALHHQLVLTPRNTHPPLIRPSSSVSTPLRPSSLQDSTRRCSPNYGIRTWCPALSRSCFEHDQEREHAPLTSCQTARCGRASWGRLLRRACVGPGDLGIRHVVITVCALILLNPPRTSLQGVSITQTKAIEGRPKAENQPQTFTVSESHRETQRPGPGGC